MQGTGADPRRPDSRAHPCPFSLRALSVPDVSPRAQVAAGGGPGQRGWEQKQQEGWRSSGHRPGSECDCVLAGGRKGILIGGRGPPWCLRAVSPVYSQEIYSGSPGVSPSITRVPVCSSLPLPR